MLPPVLLLVLLSCLFPASGHLSAQGLPPDPDGPPTSGGAAAPEPQVSFAVLELQVSGREMEGRFELFLDPSAPGAGGGVSGGPEDPPRVLIDGKPLVPSAPRREVGPPPRIVYDFGGNFERPKKPGTSRVAVLGLPCSPSTELRVSFLAGLELAVVGASPGEKDFRQIPLGKGRTHTVLRYEGCPETLVLELGLREEAVSSRLLDTAIQYGVPILTAMFILLLSTLIQRYFSLRAEQLGIYQALTVGVRRIRERPEDMRLRREFLEHLRKIREKPEYGGFSPKFTRPIERLIEDGLVDDVESYGAKVREMKFGVRFRWILFVGR